MLIQSRRVKCDITEHLVFLLGAFHIEGTHNNQIRFNILALGQHFSAQLGGAEGLEDVFSFIAVFVQSLFHYFNRFVIGIGVNYNLIIRASASAAGEGKQPHSQHQSQSQHHCRRFLETFCFHHFKTSLLFHFFIFIFRPLGQLAEKDLGNHICCQNQQREHKDLVKLVKILQFFYLGGNYHCSRAGDKDDRADGYHGVDKIVAEYSQQGRYGVWRYYSGDCFQPVISHQHSRRLPGSVHLGQ